MKRLLRISLAALLICLFNTGLSFAEHECQRSVTCSDGDTIITTSCTSSYDIVNGKIYDDDDPWHHHEGGGSGDGSGDSDDHDHWHHHKPLPDPCADSGHGHLVPDAITAPTGSNPASITSNAETNASAGDTPPADPYGLMHGQERKYDPSDPYGLKQKLDQGESSDQ